jgi:hypothetical protein
MPPQPYERKRKSNDKVGFLGSGDQPVLGARLVRGMGTPAASEAKNEE